MIKDIRLWHFIFERITKSQPVIFLCVLDSTGSSPGRKGFKMAVSEDDIFGSIGGGIMEHKFVEMAREKLSTIPILPLVRKQIHNKSANKNQSGMICSGEQTILLYYLTKTHLGLIKNIIDTLDQNQNGLLKISPEEFSFSREKTVSDFSFEMKSENEWEYLEDLGFKNHFYIIGGGHCALALSKFMSELNFHVHVFDERSGLNTFEQNTFANEKQIVENYSTLNNLIPSGRNNYVVIMTFGYRTDDIAVRALIKNDYKYFGVLGSTSKMEKMFEEWRRDKLPEEKLKNIFAPVGLNIHSQSPEEIAISIAAEIIKVKNSTK